MAESFKCKRVLLPLGKQKEFILEVKSKSGISNKEMANLLKISPRTLVDWKREKYLITLPATKILARLVKIEIPSKAKILPPFWSVKKAAKLGGKATIKRYGRICADEEKRKQGWYHWWKTKGQFLKNTINQPKIVYLPRKSEKLAEFVGIMMGDGNISDYQITITLNKVDDAEYIIFVADLLKYLFKIKPSKNIQESVVNVRISRKNLVDFCQKIGLKKGNKIKQAFDIPNWVKTNKRFMTACVRGLFDTDGSVFLHKYKVNGKYYSYTKIAFTSCSKPLLISYFQFLQTIKIKSRYFRDKDVRIDSQVAVKKYFDLIGSSNSKHIKKFKKALMERSHSSV